MILQALCGLYDRMAEDDQYETAPPGYAVTPVSKCLVLDIAGNLITVLDLMEEREIHTPSEKKNKTSAKNRKFFPRRLITPRQPKRSSSRPEPAFLCENANFLFGLYSDEAGASYRYEASLSLHQHILQDVNDKGARAVLGFFAKRKKGSLDYPGVEGIAELVDSGGNLVFSLIEDEEFKFIHQRPMIKAAWERYLGSLSEQAFIGQCLVTGEVGPIARIHGNLDGFGKDKPTLIGFNQDSFTSFGKEKGSNAPVSEAAAFKYITALNLLINDRSHCFNLHGDKVLFWAEKKAPMEEAVIGTMLDKAGTASRYKLNEVMARRIEGILKALYAGTAPRDLELNPNTRIFMLGLAANKTRVVVRYFYVNSFGELVGRLRQHQEDIRVEGAPWEPEHPSFEQILLETAVRRESKNVPPPHQVSLIRSIMRGTPYPDSLLMAMIGRIRAEAADDAAKAINRIRIGVIRGCLNRAARQLHNEELISVGLNPNETAVPYLLGRIFAILNKAQYDALEKVNASIVDKYLNAALASPQQVFTSLLANAEHHFSKSEKYWTRQLLVDVMDLMPSLGFPSTLNAEEQGQFLVGFYQQQKEFFRGAKDSQTVTSQNGIVNG